MKFFFNNEYLRFAFFVYLFNICFLTSLSQCIYFLCYNSRNINIIIFGYLSLIVVLVIALFSVKWRQFYLTLVFNEISMKAILNLKPILSVAQKQYSYTSFILFHLYIAFSVFHFMMIFLNQIETPFEMLYQFLNLIRLFFFPLILLMVSLSLFPDFFKMEGILGEATTKLMAQATTQLLDFLKEMGNIKKNPKTAGFLYVVAGTGMVATSHKYQLQKQFKSTSEQFGFNFAEVPSALVDDPEGYALYKSVLKTISQIDQSAVSLLISDIKSFLDKNPTLREELSKNLVNFKAAEALFEVKKQKSLEKANEIGLYPLARASTDSEINPADSVVSKIPTILEKFIFAN